MANLLINRRIIFPVLNYTFKNAQALAYWNALTVANGNVTVKGSIYGISDNALKRAIDMFFINGVSNGWLAKVQAMYPYIGATAPTHAINAVNPGTFNLTFIGSPTQSIYGFGTLNGSSQYARTGFIDSINGTINNSHLSALSGTEGGATATYMAARVAVATQEQTLIFSSATFNRYDTYNNVAGQGLITGTTPSTKGFIVGSRISNVNSQIYYNGVSEGTLASVGGTQPNIEYYIGCLNNAGVASSFTNYLFRFNSIGTGLTSTQVASFNNDVNNLQASLGLRLQPLIYNQANYSYYFDGSTKYILFGNNLNGSLSGATPTFSIRMIVRRLSTGTAQCIFAKTTSVGNQRQIDIRFGTGNTIQFVVSTNGSTNAVIDTTNTFTSTTGWYDILWTFDGTQAGIAKLACYVNGLSQSISLTSGALGAVFAGTGQLAFGAAVDGTAEFFNGYINQGGITSDIVTQLEATLLYNNGAPRILGDVVNNVILQTPFNSDTFSTNWTVIDEASVPHNGTSTGMTALDHDNNETPY